MNEKINLLKRVLQKLLIAKPVAPQMRTKIMRQRKGSLINVLKKIDAYSISNRLKVSMLLFERRFTMREHNKKTKVIRGFAAAALASVLVVVLFAIYNKKQQEAYTAERSKGAIVVFIAGNVSIKKVGQEAKPLMLNEVAHAEDVMTTGKNAMATLQLGNKAIIYIRENSIVTFGSLVTDQKTEIYLNQGSILSKVNKLKKGSEFSIKTSTIVASVRGTEFMVSSDEKGATIALAKGKLALTKPQPQKETILDEGNTAQVKDAITIAKISKSEERSMQALATISFIPDIKTASTEKIKLHAQKIDQELKTLEQKQNIEDKKANGGQKPLTLADIKRIHGSLVKIYTKEGRKYIGAYQQSGAKAIIITPGGQVAISGENIVKVEPYK